jgi:hypothetical protein
MNKFRLNRAPAVILLTAGIITLTGIYLTSVHAEKSGVYSQSGGTVTETDKAYAATSPDQSGVYVNNSGTYTLIGSKITKTGDTSSTEDSDFYGLNAGVLAENDSTVTLTDCTVTTDAKGANGVFAYGEGSSVTINNVTITTSKDSSRGIDATDNGIITANSCNITTTGAHCAAIASDRGSGKVIVRGGTFTTAGTDSPPIYCTGGFEIMGATLKGTGSEAAVIEGANSITLSDCTLSGAKNRGVMIYQSTSGDATGTNGTFNMTGGSLTAAVGPLFYVTNSTGIINLTAVTTTATSGTLVQAAADSWGTSGSNGGTVILTANLQTMNGNLICDSSSSITATLADNSSLTGTINTAALTLDATSKWSVTGDSYLTSLNDADTTFANINDNGHTIYYDSSLSANSWLGSKTYYLTDGGKITPGTASPSATLTPSPTVTASPESSVMPSATVITVIPTETVSPTTTVRPTTTVSPTVTVRPTTTVSPTATVRPTPSPSCRPSRNHWWWWPWQWWRWWR